MIVLLTRLHDPAFDQQRRADVAVAITTALRAFIAQTLCRIENPFTRQGFQHGPGGLQGYAHHLIPN